MELFEIKSGGKLYSFNVLRNSTEPCPQCGVPACGKEDIVWYEENGERFGVVFDGGYFELAIEEVTDKNLDLVKNDSLPDIIKEWNESKGWVDCSDYEGYQLDIDDFLNTLNLLKTCEMGKWITEEDIAGMENLAVEAQSKGQTLKIVRG